jgi:hypothetical protein
MPSRTFLAKNEESRPGYKVSRHRLTLLLGGNAEGDFKLKPMLIYHSLNPRALRGCNKASLPVIWRANKKSLVTQALSEDWFKSYFWPAVENYCKQNNLTFKALLFLHNDPGHPSVLNDLSENVKVVFLPPNTTSLLQPMDQGIVSTFKAYYPRRTFAQAVQATMEEDAISLTDFWKKFNIRQAILNIYESWQEVTANTMRAVWKYLLPYCANDFCVFENRVDAVTEEISVIGKDLGFEDVDSPNVRECLDSHSLTRTLQNWSNSVTYDEKEEIASEGEGCVSKEILIKKLEQMFRNLETVKQKITDLDPNVERSTLVRRTLENGISCYRKMYEEKKEGYICQTTLEKYFSRK